VVKKKRKQKKRKQKINNNIDINITINYMDILVSNIKSIANNLGSSNEMLERTFKTEFSFKDRFNESSKVLKEYPDKVPIIVERANNCNNVDIIDKRKYLVPNEITMSQFLWTIRKRLKLNETTALFLFNDNGITFQNTQFVSNIYQECKDRDGFLYLRYASENTFG